jgi:hypothetical protein
MDTSTTELADLAGCGVRGAELDGMIEALERQMPQLQMQHGNLFALAAAWAERYDAILARTPAELLAEVSARLARIGVRWGVMPGARVTQEFQALPQALRRKVEAS